MPTHIMSSVLYKGSARENQFFSIIKLISNGAESQLNSGQLSAQEYLLKDIPERICLRKEHILYAIAIKGQHSTPSTVINTAIF